MQILTLEILHQGQQGGLAAVHRRLDAGHRLKARKPGRPQPPLPGYQLPALSPPPDGEGLEDAVAANGGRQLPQG